MKFKIGDIVRFNKNYLFWFCSQQLTFKIIGHSECVYKLEPQFISSLKCYFIGGSDLESVVVPPPPPPPQLTPEAWFDKILTVKPLVE